MSLEVGSHKCDTAMQRGVGHQEPTQNDLQSLGHTGDFPGSPPATICDRAKDLREGPFAW